MACYFERLTESQREGFGESTAFKKCSLGTLARAFLANTVAEDGQELRPTKYEQPCQLSQSMATKFLRRI